MQRVTVVCVGKLKERFYAEAAAEYVKRLGRYCRLELVELIIGWDEVSRVKPDPEGLNLALARFGLEPGQALFCGDTVIDAATAQAGGCGFCAVLNGTTPREAFQEYPHVYIAEDLAGLQGWLGL